MLLRPGKICDECSQTTIFRYSSVTQATQGVAQRFVKSYAFSKYPSMTFSRKTLYSFGYEEKTRTTPAEFQTCDHGKWRHGLETRQISKRL